MNCTNAVRFVDTNVLIYAISPNMEERAKRRIAQKLLQNRELALSVQVMQEFYHQVTRSSLPEPLTSRQALGFLRSLNGLPVVSMTVDLFQDAVSICDRFRLSYWDSAILAAARKAGCDAVYSEDFSSEQDYDGLRVINPFQGARET